MKVLFAVWEIPPFFKVGGLGDVARSLPADLIRMGVETAVVMPYYKAVKFGQIKKTNAGKISFIYDKKTVTVEVFMANHPLNNFPVYFLRNKKYLDVVDPIDTWPFFGKSVVEAVKQGIFAFAPDIIHCNDVHTGLIPLIIKEERLPVKTILTIHNLAHQGRTNKEVLAKMGMDENKGSFLAWEKASKQLNILMEGIMHADVVTTVSPTYAKEIMTEEQGMGLDEVLRGKEGRVFGILNGISINRYYKHGNRRVCDFVSRRIEKPESIALDLAFYLEKKKENKRKLQKKLGFVQNDDIPLSCFIGRFDPYQKGLDIMHRMIRNLNLEEHQFVILGSGNVDWENKFEWFNKFYPKNISCHFTFSEELAHEIYEASNFILIPSRFEPCGLIQMLSMFFGTLPIAHRTGGLIDSIINNHNGFLFNKYSSTSMLHCYQRAVEMFVNDKRTYNVMVMAALSADFSWKKKASEYMEIYKKLVQGAV